MKHNNRWAHRLAHHTIVQMAAVSLALLSLPLLMQITGAN